MNAGHLTPAVVLTLLSPDAFFAPTAFTGQQLTTGVSTPSRTATGVTMKIFDWKRRESQDGLGEMGRGESRSRIFGRLWDIEGVQPRATGTACCCLLVLSSHVKSIMHLWCFVSSCHTTQLRGYLFAFGCVSPPAKPPENMSLLPNGPSESMLCA